MEQSSQCLAVPPPCILVPLGGHWGRKSHERRTAVRGTVRFIVAAALALAALFQQSSWALEAGFAETDITPEVNGRRPVWLADYRMGRRATGVHDPLMCRCVVLRDGEDKIALVSVDLVGLQYPEVKAIRAKLPQFKYVMVSSTHNHEGPDVIGIWGRTAFHRGVDNDYLKLVVKRAVEAVQKAEQSLTAVQAAYGTAEDESLLGDSRQPIVKDGILRVLRFDRVAGTAGILVQWNCHPEALGSRNQLVTADFPWATVAALHKKYDCPVVYITGA